MVATETFIYSLTNLFSVGNLFTLSPNANEDILATFDLADIVCIEHVQEHHLQVTFWLSNEVSFSFDTCKVSEEALELAITELFETISYDIDHLEMLNDNGLLEGLLKQHINQYK